MKKKSRDRRVLIRQLESAIPISQGEMEVFNGNVQWIMTKPRVHAKYHYDENGKETMIESSDFSEFYNKDKKGE